MTEPGGTAALPHEWSTEGLSPAHRPGAWRDHLAGLVLPIAIDAGRPRNFHGRLRVEGFGPITFLEIDSRRQWMKRGPEEIAAGPKGVFFVSVMSRGKGWLHSDAGVVQRGEVTFVDGDQPFALEFRRDFAFVSAVIPKADLLALAPHAECVHGAIVPPPAGPALGAFLISLADMARAESMTGAPRDHGPLYGHFLGLAATGVRAVVERSQATALTPDQVLLGDIKAWLIQALPDETLNGAAVARAFSISQRKVQRLFQGAGTTVPRWLMDERLSRCARDLRDPKKAGRTVTDIALGWGFSDAAHFSRAFRAAYGAPPSVWRAAK